MRLTTVESVKYYDLHPNDPTFISQMNEIVKDGTLPNTIPPGILLYWAQKSKTSFALVKRLPGTVLRKWVYTFAYDAPTHKFSYTKFMDQGVEGEISTKYNLLWENLAEVDCERIWYKPPTIELDANFTHLLDSVLAKYGPKYEFVHNKHDPLSSDSLYTKSKVHVRVLLEAYDTCAVINKVKLPSLRGCYTGVNFPSHFLVHKQSRLKLECDYTGQICVYFRIYFIEVRDWAWRKYVGPKVAIFEEYKSKSPSIDQLRTWAKEEWQVTGRTKEDILQRVEDKLYKGNWLILPQ